MKPFLRYRGNTVSDFAPLINDDNYHRLNDWFKERNGGPLVDPTASSRKLKSQTKMISIIKASLKGVEPTEYAKFVQTFSDAKQLTEKKRQYLSTFGYSNVKEYMNFETDTLIEGDSFERHSFSGCVDWWKNKASKRYESLKADGRLRRDLETFNVNPDEITIIR